MIWKPLLDQGLDRSDLEAVDIMCVQTLNALINIDQTEVTETNFHDYITENFTTTSSDGQREIELIEKGATIPVTFERRAEYAKLVEEYRLNEFKLQVKAIASGLATIVPISVLKIFTWKELEYMICGKPEIDTEVLKKHTVYKDGVNKNDSHVQMLWQVLEGFTHEERAMFIRFTWGRSRLPNPQTEWPNKFTIQPYTRAAGNVDKYLPESHTCFFSIDLPRYSNIDIMKEKILYAINFCQAIDTDFNVHRVEEWD